MEQSSWLALEAHLVNRNRGLQWLKCEKGVAAQRLWLISNFTPGLRVWVRTVPSLKGLGSFFHFTQRSRAGLRLFRPGGAEFGDVRVPSPIANPLIEFSHR